MASRIILLSGPVNAGKTTLGVALSTRYGFDHFRTHEIIKVARPQVLAERGAMQSAGEDLDRRTHGNWVAEALAKRAIHLKEDSVIVVDAVRTKGQVDGIRAEFGLRVVHVHLTAPDDELELRYSHRISSVKEFTTYAEVRENKTERSIEDLARNADIVIDTRRSTRAAVVVRVAAYLELYGRGYERAVDVLVGGQFGSEGKGNVASYLRLDRSGSGRRDSKEGPQDERGAHGKACARHRRAPSLRL